MPYQLLEPAVVIGAQVTPLSDDICKKSPEVHAILVKSADAVMLLHDLLPALVSAVHDTPLSSESQMFPVPATVAAIFVKSGEAVMPHQPLEADDVVTVFDGYLPAGHNVHPVLPASEYMPGGHGVVAVAPPAAARAPLTEVDEHVSPSSLEW